MNPDVRIGLHRATIGGLTKGELAIAKLVSSYAVDGAGFNELFRKKMWDGRDHQMRKEGLRHSVPLGLLTTVVAAIESDGGREVVVVDERPPMPARALNFGFTAPLRDYQQAAVDAFVGGGDAPSWAHHLGVLRMSVRSGKTRTAFAIADRLGMPTFFVVTSQLLLQQAAEVARELCPYASVGVLGDGELTIGDITIATIQGLFRARDKNKPLWKQITRTIDGGLVVFDEAHHLTAKKWKKTTELLHGRARLGLSATVFADDDDTPGKASPTSILLTAATGPVLHTVSMRDLMTRGFLVPCTVEMLRVEGRASLLHREWSQDHWHDAIFGDEKRNAAIVKRAGELAREGRRVIITTTRTEHAGLLGQMLADAGIPGGVLIGPDSATRRRQRMTSFRTGPTRVLVSTVLGEGVDVPECDAVIVGEGGASRVAALQRMRCLTPSPGKNDCIVVDVVDTTSRYTAAHTKARIDTYRAESCFRLTSRNA